MIQAISRAALSLAFLGFATGTATAQPFAYVANSQSDNISGYTIDSVTGALTEVAGSPFPAGSNPQFVVATPSGKFVYAANSDSDNISAYSLNGTSGALTPIAGSPFPAGQLPFGLAISPSGKFLYAGNANSANISGFSINGTTGALTPLSGSPFAGAIYPEWLVLTPSGKYLYACNSSYGTVSAFAVSSDGSLQLLGSPYTVGGYPAGPAVSPSGKFLYVPNQSNISAFSIDGATGALTPISGSPFTTGGVMVAVTPSGQFLYAPDGPFGGGVFAFRVDKATGTLKPIPGSPFAGGVDPFYVAISSSGQFAYVSDANGNQMSEYSIDSSTGALTPLPGSPFTVDGNYPDTIALVNPAVKACGALDVSREATLARGPYTRQSRKSDLWNETLTVTNGVTPISGPLSVVLLGLPSSTTTLSGTYPGLSTTYCFSTAGNYVVPIDTFLPSGNNDTLLPGEVFPCRSFSRQRKRVPP